MIRIAFASIATVFCLWANAQTPKYENLAFEGAGIRGIAYCGALEKIEKMGVLADIKRVAGTSSGAITSALLSVGYTPAEIYEIIGSTDFGEFNDGRGGMIGGVHRLRKKLGYYKGDRFLMWFKDLIEKKTGNGNITFGELKQLAATRPGFRELTVTATSLNHQEAIFFDAFTYPTMQIAVAVRASMAVPLYFEPMIIDPQGNVVLKKNMKPEDHLCVDGGFTTNFPIQVFDHAPYCNGDSDKCLGKTLGLRIDSEDQITRDRLDHELIDIPINTTGDFMQAFYYLVKETMNRFPLTTDDWNRTISISDTNLGPKVKTLSAEQKKKLMDAGTKGVEEYFGK